MPPKDPEKRQAYQREYCQRPEVQAHKREYRRENREKLLAHKRENHQRPEVKAHRREYNRLYREKHREKLLAQNREYHQRPEVKARLAQRARERARDLGIPLERLI